MSENPGECAYQYCTKPQSEQVYYLCETHYQQAWDNVLSKSPARNAKHRLDKLRARRKPDGTWEFTPRTCSRGHYIDPTNITTQIKSGKICCRACNRARARINREKSLTRKP